MSDKLQYGNLSSLSPHPALILAALREILEPTPILSQVPTTLQLFAHVQLLARRVHEECIHIIKLQKKIIRKLSNEGLSDLEVVERGALSEREGNEVKDIKDGHPRSSHTGTEAKDKRDQDRRMLAFSLEFRKYHIARLLSTPKLPLPDVLRIIDSYFPDVSGAEASLSNHPTLFIRTMRQDQIAIFKFYRVEVMRWYHRALKRTETNQPFLGFRYYYLNDRDNGAAKSQSLVHNVLKETERVVTDIQTLEEIFIRTNRGRGTKEESEEREEVVGQKTVMNRKGKGKEVEPDRLISLPTYNGKTRLPSPSLGSGSRGAVTQRDKPGSHPGVFDLSNLDSGSGSDSDSDPGPDPNRDTATTSKYTVPPRPSSVVGRTQADLSPDVNRRRTMPNTTIPSSIPSPLPIRRSPVAYSRDSGKATVLASASGANGKAPSPGPSTSTSSNLNPTAIATTSTGTSSIKKRKPPRQSFPPTGPEYTLASISSQTLGGGKERLRPFENSQLERNGFKKPRMSQTSTTAG